MFSILDVTAWFLQMSLSVCCTIDPQNHYEAPGNNKILIPASLKSITWKFPKKAVSRVVVYLYEVMVRQRGTHIFTTSGDENSRNGRVHQVLPLWTDVVNGALSLTTTHRLKRNQKKSLCASLMCFLLAYITSLLTLVTLAIKRAEKRQAQWRTCSHALLLVISHQCAEEREGDTSLWWSAISIVWGWNTFKGAQRKAKSIKACTARRRKRRREEIMRNRKYCEHKFNSAELQWKMLQEHHMAQSLVLSFTAPLCYTSDISLHCCSGHIFHITALKVLQVKAEILKTQQWTCTLSFCPNAGDALQIQCYQCEEMKHNDCSTPEYIVNCTVNVQDMCQKEVLVKPDGEFPIRLFKVCSSLCPWVFYWCKNQPSLCVLAFYHQ